MPPQRIAHSVSPSADGDLACEQRRHARRARALDDLPRGLDQVGDGDGDLVLGHRHDLVDEVADDGERQPPGPLDRDAVGDGPRAIGDDGMSGRERGRDRGARRRLHADDAHAGPQRLGGNRNPRDEPAAADGHDDGVDLGAGVEEFEADRALPGDDARVVERVDERQPALGDQFVDTLRGIVEGGAVEDDLGAESARGSDFGERRALGHDDDRRHAERPGGEGDTLRVVARRLRDDAARALVVGQVDHAVEGAAHLEGAADLRVLGFEEHGRAVLGAEHRVGQQRRHARHPGDADARRLDVVEGDEGCGGVRRWGHGRGSGQGRNRFRKVLMGVGL